MDSGSKPWEAEVEKELVELFRASFDEIWPSLTTLIDKKRPASDSEINAGDGLYSGSCDFFQRMLLAARIIPEVHTSLSCSVVCQIQKTASSVLKSFNDKHAIESDSQSHEIVNLLKILQISNEILDCFCQKDGPGMEMNMKTIEKAMSVLFEDLIEFLTFIKGKQLEKGTYIRLLLTARKIWTFLKSRSSECDIVQVLSATIQKKKDELFSRNPNAPIFIRFVSEMLTKTEGVDWKSIVIQNIRKDDFLSLLIPVIEIDSKIVDAEIIEQVRKGLSSKDSERRKEAAFIIKSMSSILAGSGGESIGGSSEMLIHLGQEKFINFWSNYFELYEILDEKQSHIVQPVLLSKLGIFDQADNLTCKWYFVIISKMIHHDNRHIAKEGFVRFMNNRIRDERDDLRKDMFETFLNSEVLPFLKDHAGWILSEPQEFFKSLQDFGSFLQQLYGDELLMVETIVGFVVQDSKCLSPYSLYFLIRSLHHGLELGTGIPEQLTSTEEEKLKKCFSLICKCTKQGLTTVDKFLRLRVEETFVDIVSRWGNHLGRMCEYSLISLPQTQTTSLEPSVITMSNIYSFFGSLSLVTIVDNSKSRAKLVNLEKDFFNKCRDCSIGWKTLLGNDFSPLELRGVFRLKWITSLKDPLLNRDIIGDLSEMEVFSKNFESGTVQAETDFVQGLAKSFEMSNEKQDKDFEIMLTTLRQSCVSRIERVFQIVSNLERNRTPFAILQDSRLLCFVEIVSKYFEKDLQLPHNLCSIGDELLVLDYQEGEDHCYGVTRNFIVWNLIGLVPDEFDNRRVEKLIDLFSVRGFDTLKLKSSTYENPVDEYRITYGFNLTSEFYKVKFDSFARVLERRTEKKVGTLEMWKKCIASGLDHVEKAGPGGVISSLRFFKAALPFLKAFDEDDDILIDIWDMLIGFTYLAWKLVFEMRKTESFWTGIREFVELITQPFYSGQGILTRFADRMFKNGETVTGLPLVLVEKLADKLRDDEITLESSEIEEIIEVCLTAVCFGPTLMKTNRVTFGLWAYLNSKDQVDLLQDESSYGSNAKTRVTGVWILQRLVKLMDKEAMEKVLVVLLDKNDEESRTRKRYYGNSQTHRIKQRITQTILMLQPYFDLELSKLVLQRLMDSLTTDSPQPSVRYLSEWVIIKMLLKYPELWKSFFETSIQCCSKRVGFGAFFSTICLHTSTHIDSNTEEQFFFEKSLSALAELILGHHVTVRIYAQACFREIYKIVQLKGWTVLQKKYCAFQEALDADSMNSGGNFSKLLEAVSKDFYLQTFNVKTHYIPEVIFVYLPRLSEIADDELPLESYMTFKKPFYNMFCGDSKELKLMYKSYENLAWHLKATSGDGRELGEEVSTNVVVADNQVNSEESSSLINFQKKINPWKSLSVVDQIDDFSLEFLTKKRSAMEDGLIVVASLIDKIPNLGGLCRSCEIFGVSKYVIPSLKILQDQNFVSLSVSAHNWVDILEVPPRDLEAFISTYAAKGYKILGVEQALESTRLNDFQFPRKSLLLLGNEKYGIPTNLIHLVDQCLEIPQVGVIRSLNVHVTGALCIWQYAAQHSFS